MIYDFSKIEDQNEIKIKNENDLIELNGWNGNFVNTKPLKWNAAFHLRAWHALIGFMAHEHDFHANKTKTRSNVVWQWEN